MAEDFYRSATKLLREAGWAFERQGKGSHEVWAGPNGRRVTVPRNLKRRHTANAILKQAGLALKL
ncbi:MAG: type II toxin-antitoxin system HicA family toxin [Pseudomonadota bacterium]